MHWHWIGMRGDEMGRLIQDTKRGVGGGVGMRGTRRDTGPGGYGVRSSASLMAGCTRRGLV